MQTKPSLSCKQSQMRKIPKDNWRQIHNVNANRGHEVRVKLSLSRNLKKRQKDRKMSLVKEEAKEDSAKQMAKEMKQLKQSHEDLATVSKAASLKSEGIMVSSQ